MPSTIIQTNTIKGGGSVWDSLGNYYSFWLLAGVSAAADAGKGINITHTNVAVIIDGSLFSDPYAGISSGAQSTRVTIGESGSVTTSHGPAAIDTSNGNCSINNAGTISAEFGGGVAFNSGNNIFVNSGEVNGRHYALFLGASVTSSNDTIVNSGKLIAAGTADNLGSRYGHAVQIESDAAILTNSGLIATTGAGTGAAIHIGPGDGSNRGDGAQIRNLADGEIISGKGAGISAEGLVLGALTINNAGLIQGGYGASSFVGGNSNVIVLTNSGTMRGTVNISESFSADIKNSGLIDGNMVLGSLLGITFTNTGEVDGFVSVINVVNNTIVNKGTINGDVGGAGAIDLKNHGTIEGDINFATTGGIYAGARGHVYGTIRTQGDATVTGGTDDDTVLSLGGKLTANGRGGDDILGAGTGLDKLTGGAGADTFVFAGEASSTVEATGRDLIRDFSHAQGDIIDLSTIIDGDLDFAGKAKFSGANEVRYEVDGKSTFVYVNLDADKTPEMAVEFKGKIAFVDGDFML